MDWFETWIRKGRQIENDGCRAGKNDFLNKIQNEGSGFCFFYKLNYSEPGDLRFEWPLGNTFENRRG
jgi:hypothetical protein